MNKKIIDKLNDIVLSEKNKFIKLAHDIWRHPELGFEEKFACSRQIKLLKELGFDIKSPYAGLPTAYKASYGVGGPVFCFVAEYDALPDVGHACGHNLICSAAIAAGRALSLMIKDNGIKGTVVVMGTPAEESKGGKVIMLENNALNGINAMMMAHPSWRTVADPGSTAIRRFEVSFKGELAHAAAAPELGINALDAVMTVFYGVNAWRQHLPESARIHGIIVDGGKVANIVPAYASCRFFLRYPNDSFLDTMEQRFRNIVEGAALITGTIPEIKMMGHPYMSRKPNQALNQLFIKTADRLGMDPILPEHSGRGSSDFGNFSHSKPGIHPYFAIAQREIAAHSEEFAIAANSEYAMKQMLKIAAAMAAVGYEYLNNKVFRKDVENNKEN